MNISLPNGKAVKLAEAIKSAGLSHVYDYEKHRVIINDDKGKEVIFRLPVNIHSLSNTDKINYVILLIQSGSSSLGYYEDEKNLNHKVFTAYMVRQKQGKSQIKYLKTKGKSRAGSRVRLGETAEFFESINERLQNYFSNYKIDRIAIGCSKILIPYLYNAKVKCPFDKKDSRLFKIPKHVELPNNEVMNGIHKFLLRGELIFEEDQEEFIEQLLDFNSDE